MTTHVSQWGGGDAAPDDLDDAPTLEMAPAGSLHERLLAARDSRTEPRLKLDVTAGPYAGMLRVEYRPLPWAMFERLAARMQSGNDVNANLDAMGQCCVRVIGVHPDGLEEVLDDGAGALRLDERLARYLQMPCADGPVPPTSREVIVQLFDGNGLAIAAHATDLIEWAKAPDVHGEIDPGKILGSGWMEAAAAATLAGIAPMDLLRAPPMERAFLIDVANRAWALHVARDDALATRIINRLADAMKR